MASHPGTNLKRLTTAAEHQPATTNKRHKPQHKTNQRILIGAGATLLLAYPFNSYLSYRQTLQLGEAKHVNQLLSLSEEPTRAATSYMAIQEFRKSNWRKYISPTTLILLNLKGTRLARAMEVDSLDAFLRKHVTRPVNHKSASEILWAYKKAKASTAFSYLNADTLSLANKASAEAYSITQRLRQEEKERADAQRAADLARQAAEIEAARATEEAGISSNYSMGNGYQLGPRGGCFYWSGSSKVYVDRSNCL